MFFKGGYQPPMSNRVKRGGTFNSIYEDPMSMFYISHIFSYKSSTSDDKHCRGKKKTVKRWQVQTCKHFNIDLYIWHHYYSLQSLLLNLPDYRGRDEFRVGKGIFGNWKGQQHLNIMVTLWWDLVWLIWF